MKSYKKQEYYFVLVCNVLAQIHTTLLEIMQRVGNGSATIETHNETIKELQEEQSETIRMLKKCKT